MTKFITALVSVLVAPGLARAAATADWSVQAERTIATAAKFTQKGVEETRAKQALDLLKALRDESNQVRDSADSLFHSMRDHHYVDWADTKLLQPDMQARAYNDTIKQTYDLEKKNLKTAQKAAEAGDNSGLLEIASRVSAFEADYEVKIKAVDAQVAEVRALYAHHWGNAQAALAEALKGRLLQEMLAQKQPKLISEVKLEPENLRPIKWQIVVHKDDSASDDARFGQLPKAVSIDDAGATLWYRIIVK